MSVLPKRVTSPTLRVFVAATLLAGLPYGFSVSKGTIAFGETVSMAKNGGGNGNGRNGGGNGGGNGNNGGKGSGNGSNNAGGKGSQMGKGQAKSKSAAGMTVNHPNGIAESILNGRYIMTDSKGRTIVNRLSRPADLARLKALVR